MIAEAAQALSFCPACRRLVDIETVLCPACGFDARTPYEHEPDAAELTADVNRLTAQADAPGIPERKPDRWFRRALAIGFALLAVVGAGVAVSSRSGDPRVLVLAVLGSFAAAITSLCLLVLGPAYEEPGSRPSGELAVAGYF